MNDHGKRQRKPAIGYIRQSSATNVGEGNDGGTRQRRAIQAYANKAGYRIVEWASDLDVPGTDPIDMRPGFSAALELIAGNGVSTIIVETANRFARDLMVQEAGCQRLKAAGIALIAADKPDSFTDDTPTAKLVRQILGAVAEFDKAMLVAKLAGARQRKRRLTGKCGGRRNYTEVNPQMVALARHLRGGNGWRPYSLRDVAAELAAYGYTTSTGKPYSASAVQSMLG